MTLQYEFCMRFQFCLCVYVCPDVYVSSFLNVSFLCFTNEYTIINVESVHTKWMFVFIIVLNSEILLIQCWNKTKALKELFYINRLYIYSIIHLILIKSYWFMIIYSGFWMPWLCDIYIRYTTRCNSWNNLVIIYFHFIIQIFKQDLKLWEVTNYAAAPLWSGLSLKLPKAHAHV